MQEGCTPIGLNHPVGGCASKASNRRGMHRLSPAVFLRACLFETSTKILQEIAITSLCDVDCFAGSRFFAKPPAEFVRCGCHVAALTLNRHSFFCPTLSHDNWLAQEFRNRSPAGQHCWFGCCSLLRHPNRCYSRIAYLFRDDPLQWHALWSKTSAMVW